MTCGCYLYFWHEFVAAGLCGWVVWCRACALHKEKGKGFSLCCLGACMARCYLCLELCTAYSLHLGFGRHSSHAKIFCKCDGYSGERCA